MFRRAGSSRSWQGSPEQWPRLLSHTVKLWHHVLPDPSGDQSLLMPQWQGTATSRPFASSRLDAGQSEETTGKPWAGQTHLPHPERHL